MNYELYMDYAKNNDFKNIQTFLDKNIIEATKPANNNLRYFIATILVYMEMSGTSKEITYFKYADIDGEYSMSIPYLFYKNVSYKLLDDFNARSIWFNEGTTTPSNLMLISPFKSTWVDRVIVNGKKCHKDHINKGKGEVNIVKAPVSRKMSPRTITSLVFGSLWILIAILLFATGLGSVYAGILLVLGIVELGITIYL